MSDRLPIGCGEEEAIRYLGCSSNLFAELRAAKIVKPIRKGYYSYRLLDLALERLESEVSGHVLEIYDSAKASESVPVKRRTRGVGSVGDPPSEPSTEALLRAVAKRSQR